jgi:hypothetical protein
MSLIDHNYTAIIPNKYKNKKPIGEIGVAYIQNFQIKFYINENYDLIAAYSDDRVKMLNMHIDFYGDLIISISDDKEWLINSLPHFHITEDKNLIMEVG